MGNLTQDQLNAGWTMDYNGNVYWSPGFPIAAVVGGLLGLLINGSTGLVIGGGGGYLIGRAFLAQQANAVLPAGAISPASWPI